MNNSVKTYLKILVVIFCISVVFNIIGFDWDNIEIRSFESTVVEVTKIVFSIIVSNLLIWAFPIIVLLAIYIGGNIHKRAILSKEDLIKFKDYYRDILYGYSIASISYIDNFEINEENIISSILLSLKQKDIIDFNEVSDKIEVKNTEKQLFESEKYILSKIIDGKLSDTNINELENIIKNETETAQLIKRKKISIKKILKYIALFSIIIILALFVGNDLFGKASNLEVTQILLFSLVSIVISCSPIIIILLLVSYIRSNVKHPYERTSKGEKVNKKLEGLKNYLKDFSNLDEKEANSIILWEDYLIYSVIFGHNKYISDEILMKYTDYYSINV